MSRLKAELAATFTINSKGRPAIPPTSRAACSAPLTHTRIVRLLARIVRLLVKFAAVTACNEPAKLRAPSLLGAA